MCLLFYLDFVVLVQGGIVEHGRADAELAVLGHQDIVVDTAFTSLPERLVVGQFVEGDGHVTQFGVHLHDGRAAGKTEYLGPRPSEACQAEGGLFDTFCQSYTLVFGVYYQTGSGYVLLVAPAFDVGETSKFIATESDDSFSLFHFGGYIFVCALGNSCAAFLGGFPYGVENCIHINFM